MTQSTSDTHLHDLSRENRLYYEVFKSELAQIADKSLADKQDLQETLLADLIRLSAKGQTAKTFFGMSARQLAQNWAGELPVPSFSEALKSGIIPTIILLIPTLFLLTSSHSSTQFKIWVGIPYGVMCLLSLLGGWILSKLFPKMSPQTRYRVGIIISIPFAVFGIAALIFFM